MQPTIIVLICLVVCTAHGIPSSTRRESSAKAGAAGIGIGSGGSIGFAGGSASGINTDGGLATAEISAGSIAAGGGGAFQYGNLLGSGSATWGGGIGGGLGAANATGTITNAVLITGGSSNGDAIQGGIAGR